ncbi:MULTISPECIES: hypothetical protein [Pseudomonas]|nr:MULTISPECIES: hypothetical protein [Pseudomonas]UMZ12921.1 hypothetical protein I9018_04255 [Pseudomonas sp. MPFS]
MDHEPLPSTWVIEEARTFIRAAQILEQRAIDDHDLNLFWPAVMNSALACELLLKSCLVEADPCYPRTEHDPEGHLRLGVRIPGNGHGLIDLYHAISPKLANQLREISERLAPDFPLEKWIRASSKLFVGTRYPYEANSVQSVDLEVLKLAPHLDRVLEEMTRWAHDQGL